MINKKKSNFFSCKNIYRERLYLFFIFKETKRETKGAYYFARNHHSARTSNLSLFLSIQMIQYYNESGKYMIKIIVDLFLM